MLTFADMEGGETFDASFLGTAEEVSEERVADDELLVIKGPKNTRAVSIACTSSSICLPGFLIHNPDIWLTKERVGCETDPQFPCLHKKRSSGYLSQENDLVFVPDCLLFLFRKRVLHSPYKTG